VLETRIKGPKRGPDDDRGFQPIPRGGQGETSGYLFGKDTRSPGKGDITVPRNERGEREKSEDIQKKAQLSRSPEAMGSRRKQSFRGARETGGRLKKKFS